jgi:DNA-binding XRE family transcriptional regulator
MGGHAPLRGRLYRRSVTSSERHLTESKRRCRNVTTMDDITRPEPIGEARHGPVYDIAEVVAYRKAKGVTQEELARSLHFSRPYISMIESEKRPVIQAKLMKEMLGAIDLLGTKKANLMAEGRAELERIRAARPRR